MDIINVPTFKSCTSTPLWHNFFARVHPWSDDYAVPAQFMIIRLDEARKYIYEPILPFDLERDECASWLSWSPITTIDGINIRALKVDLTNISGQPPTSIARYKNIPLFLNSLTDTDREVETHKSTDKSLLSSLTVELIKHKDDIVREIKIAKEETISARNNFRRNSNGNGNNSGSNDSPWYRKQQETAARIAKLEELATAKRRSPSPKRGRSSKDESNSDDDIDAETKAAFKRWAAKNKRSSR